jgi:hypothetical protein
MFGGMLNYKFNCVLSGITNSAQRWERYGAGGPECRLNTATSYQKGAAKAFTAMKTCFDSATTIKFKF